MQSPDTILVPVDFSAQSRVAGLRACALARQAGLGVRLFHAVPLPAPVLSQEFPVPPAVWEAAKREAAERLEAFRLGLSGGSAGVVEIETRLDEGHPTRAIEAAAAASDVALVVMGTHSRGPLGHWVLGSVAERSVRSCGAPVMVVKGDEQAATEPIRRILVATDFSESSTEALREAGAWARHCAAAVELVHVVAEPQPFITAYALNEPEGLLHDVRRRAGELLEEWARREELAGVTVTTCLLQGTASTEIAQRAGEFGAHLVVTGSRGHTGIKHLLLGSVAERVLRQATCTVLVARRRADGRKPLPDRT